jgi:hypothetical protein
MTKPVVDRGEKWLQAALGFAGFSFFFSRALLRPHPTASQRGPTPKPPHESRLPLVVRRDRVLIWLSLASLALAACVGDKKRDLEAERQRLKEYILEQAPKALENKLAVSFEDKVSLLGYDVSPSKHAKPGDTIKLEMYWRLEKDLEPGWNLFTHVLDASGQRLLNIDNVGPLREWKGDSQALPPGDWEVGKVYVDEQTFVVPKGITRGDIKVVTGIWKKEERLKVSQGQADTENRALVVSIGVGDDKKKARRSSKKADRTPRLRVQMLDDDQSITIDGKLDEKAWRRAAATRRFVNVKTGSSNKQFPVNGRAKLLWDEKFLYVAFEVEDKDITGGFEKGAKDPHLWTKDTVEIMVEQRRGLRLRRHRYELDAAGLPQSLEHRGERSLRDLGRAGRQPRAHRRA